MLPPYSIVILCDQNHIWKWGCTACGKVVKQVPCFYSFRDHLDSVARSYSKEFPGDDIRVVPVPYAGLMGVISAL